MGATAEGMPDNAGHGCNLLTEPLLTVDDGERVSLPGLFAGLATGSIERSPRLRAHQRTCWHMFLVQLATLALDHAGRNDLPQNPDTWAKLLRDLSTAENEGTGDNPWRLVVEDRGSPAFLQPPDPGGLEWKQVATTPDALDVLITSRNHDLKREIAYTADPEDWVYAIVSLQTMAGYGGGGGAYKRIARMSSGYASRSFLGLIPARDDGTLDRAAWWRRDVELCIAHRDLDSRMQPGGIALIWCRPWPEGEQLAVPDLDPLAIEVCRRVRLIDKGEGLIAQKNGSKHTRINANALNGALGDPWAPISRNANKPESLNIGQKRFDYRQLFDLLFSGNWRVPLAAQLQKHESSDQMLLLAEALGHGQSKTFGLQSRIVPLPKKKISGGLFGQSNNSFADAAARQMEDIQNAETALGVAIELYSTNGDRDVYISRDERKQKTEANDPAKFFCNRLDVAADAVFFDHLWDRAHPATRDVARQAFRETLVKTANAELERAFANIPTASAFNPRARVRAHKKLIGMLRQKELFEPESLNE